MTLTPRQIREQIREAKKIIETCCPHTLVFFNIDDTGYGTIREWVCFTCRFKADSECYFPKAKVIFDDDMLVHLVSRCAGFRNEEAFFKYIREELKEWKKWENERHMSVTRRFRIIFKNLKKEDILEIDSRTDPEKVEKIIARISKVLGS